MLYIFRIAVYFAEHKNPNSELGFYPKNVRTLSKNTEKNMNFILSINYIIWLVASALFFAFGEYMSKKFALNPGWKYVVYMVIIYSFGVLAWLPAIMQKKQLSITGVIWSVMSLLATFLIGVLIFKEKLSLVGILGVIFALAAIVLLSLEH